MLMQKLLEERWRPDWNDSLTFGRLRDARSLAFRAAIGLEAARSNRERMVTAGELSEKGVAEAQRKFAREKIVPDLRRSAHKMDTARAEIAATCKSLMVGKPDKTDVAGAILRADVRTWLRSIGNPLEVGKILMDPDIGPEILAAVTEAPPAMCGITPEIRNHIEKVVLERTHSETLAVLDEMEEAATVIEAGLLVGISAMADEIGIEVSSPAFDKWMQEASIEIDSQLGKETGAADPIDLKLVADAINRMSEKQRKAINDFATKAHFSAIGSDLTGTAPPAVPIPDFGAAA